ncbi:SDR family NAD(P)-dependent oxidoreductase [Saccharopolyspora sp. K220]|uniref:SDR family NAD(P)-dependent oxidoreductase n=1 Tax=Saccharopolyspora soli TaxID=2926618 RepID=UPI001F57F5BA|nr:SDR family NAD(P)-dependent oxidoreductase [Saccharopolyspora soli]MCI2423248.1 SDR family NAD(P)-dependent oxidoreductase [Saccharopolyspora soli]
MSSIVLVTGATEGIGFEAVRQLNADGATTILHARTREEGEDAVERLVKSGSEPLRLRLAVADFTSLREVAVMADEIAAEFPRLDVLVNNAAMVGSQRQALTEDGHEVTLQVNYLAAYLLTSLLEEAMRRASASRVVNVSSSLHCGGSVKWTDLNRTRRYTPAVAYAQSKLALTMFTKALAEYDPSGRTAVSVHPGIVNTKLLSNYAHRGRSVSEGAEPVVHLCSSEVAVHNGAYYDGRLPAKPAPTAEDSRAVERLWKLSARLTRPSEE